MNIFYLDHNPMIAAWYHCDKHVLKMIIEYAQLMSTAHHELGSATEEMYEPTHRNSAPAVWVRLSEANYLWTWRLFRELCAQYTERYSKIHKTSELLKPLFSRPKGLPNIGLTEPPQYMPKEYRRRCPVAAYRAYYIGDKSRFATWKRAPIPAWYTEGRGMVNNAHND